MAGGVEVSGRDLKLLAWGAAIFVASQRDDSEAVAKYLEGLMDIGGVPELLMALVRVSEVMSEAG